MGTDTCPVCGRGGGEAVLCFRCNGCPGHCKCQESKQEDAMTKSECDISKPFFPNTEKTTRVEALEARVAVLEGALQRINDMAGRPRCVCGTQTGTAAIKACAKQALGGRDD